MTLDGKFTYIWTDGLLPFANGICLLTAFQKETLEDYLNVFVQYAHLESKAVYPSPL